MRVAYRSWLLSSVCRPNLKGCPGRTAAGVFAYFPTLDVCRHSHRPIEPRGCSLEGESKDQLREQFKQIADFHEAGNGVLPACRFLIFLGSFLVPNVPSRPHHTNLPRSRTPSCSLMPGPVSSKVPNEDRTIPPPMSLSTRNPPHIYRKTTLNYLGHRNSHATARKLTAKSC